MAISPCDTSVNRQGRELKNHGTALFPAACYHDNLFADDVPWHWHDELEAVLVSEGETVVAAGTEKWKIGQGDGFFVNAAVLHAAWHTDAPACAFHSIVFHPRLVGGGADSIFWQGYVEPLIKDAGMKGMRLSQKVDWQSEALRAVESAWQSCAAEAPGYEFAMRDALSRVVFLLWEHRKAAPGRPSEKALRNGERVKTMLRFMQERYAEELTTAQIAASASISPSECLRCFRATIGAPPIQYLIQLRTQKAAELLAFTDQRIAEVGASCGFREMSYFAKTFKAMRGVTPTEYRAQALERLRRDQSIRE